MTTRLDRLLLLLDTGSTPVTRKAAALQLGEVQKLHPHELPNLLSRVHVFLKSSNWDTRIAAGQAIEAIVKNVPKWDPAGNPIKDEHAQGGSGMAQGDGRLQFSQFDIRRVLQHGEPLVGSAGDEYDIIDEELQGLDPKERVAHQQAQVRKKLGLDMIPGVDLGMNDIIDDDVINSFKETYKKPISKRQKSVEVKSTADIVAAEIAAISNSSGMSSREKNRLKRKAKVLAKQKSRESADPPTANSDELSEDCVSKKRRTASVVVDQPADPDKIVVDSVTADSSVIFEESGEWPFEWFCYELAHDLFHQSWEVRHGAATGLREIIKHHGSGAGKTVETAPSKMVLCNLQWLEDMALRLLCVFALDRFADFVSDEVVAPVRETCAQTLGVILKHMIIESVKNVLSVILTLLAESQWEVRQGGLLGLRYLLAVRQDMTDQVLPLILEPVIASLEDVDDDVRAVAAAALLPAAQSLITLVPQKLPGILCILWDTLLDLDDLTASTNSIMLLLASMLACPNVSMETMISACQGESLSTLVPRVWPFLGHNIKSVRLASLNTLKTLLSSKLNSQSNSHWIQQILQDALRHIFQRFVLEPDCAVLQEVFKVWEEILNCSSSYNLSVACIPWIYGWLVMLTNPASMPIDKTLLIQAEHKTHTSKVSKNRQAVPQSEPSPVLIGGVTTRSNEASVLRARLSAARGLGLLASRLDQQGVDVLCQTLMIPLNSVSAIQRTTAAVIVSEWADTNRGLKCSDVVSQRLLAILTEQLLYDEVAVLNSRLQADCQSLLIGLLEKGIDASGGVQPGCYTIDSAAHLATTVFTEVTKAFPSKDVKVLEGKQRHLLVTIGQLQSEYQKLHTRVQASAARSLISLSLLPDKLNPIIRPVMEAVKKEEELQMQERAASSLTKLLESCIQRKSSPNAKILKNLCSFVCGDPSYTPRLNPQETAEPPPPSPATPSSVTPSPNTSSSSRDCHSPVLFCNQADGILTLVKQHKFAAAATSGRKSTSNLTKLRSLGSSSDAVTALSSDVPTDEDEESSRLAAVQRRGAELALTTLAKHFKASLPDQLPQLWETFVGEIQTHVQCDARVNDQSIDDVKAQSLVNALQIFEVVTAHLDPSLHSKVLDLLPRVVKCLLLPYTAVRHMAARCMGVLSKVVTMETMEVIVREVLRLVETGDNPINRQGAMEALAHVIDKLGMDLVPYIVLLIVPVLGRMSDQCESVRLLASQCFATLVSLMPLESGVPDPPGMCQELAQQRLRDRRFLEQLLDGSKLDNFHIPVPIKAELRKYQQDGVNWLAFLNRYKLQGILCDDMGLGKTLQSICIMAGDHFNKAIKFRETGSVDCKPLPSLVICPPTLTGHWVYEVEKFISNEHLSPLHYTGSPSERQRLRNKVKKHNLVVASYDIVRNDCEFFLSTSWNYCILDEGHIIKNGKTKLAKVIKQIRASHRLILSGTPIQNNVLELWSLFDFLMPGFLGTEKQFQAQYGKPILQSRDAKSSSKEQEAGALAMEGLHRQVLPFLLRRLKEDVLQDLPPKIIQDYYCELSPLQVQLYEDFAKSRAKKGIDDSFSLSGVSDEGSGKQKKGATHIFQALQYLRKVCNHPLLVLTPQHPEFERISLTLQQQKTALRDIQHAAKLVALRQLLLDCGIGMNTASEGSGDVLSDPVVSQHRVLLFCQLKSMLDIVENDLLRNHMPSVTYLRLDGSTPAGSRHSIVHRFNNDPSIDMLLLTTHVGGLGLNLTGADTVIFVEHDWNPMKDLQAMDRAHRIGQKKVVNVYRLITRGTLEEKIMGLQKFKLNIANTVITQDNSSLQTMDTAQLLDLFSVDLQGAKKEQTSDGASGNSSLKAVMETLGDLWEETQYESEYNLDTFMQSLE